jgi:hypothetical protein
MQQQSIDPVPQAMATREQNCISRPEYKCFTGSFGGIADNH